MTAKMGTREFTRISIMREIAHLPECRRRASSQQIAQPPGLNGGLQNRHGCRRPGTPCLGADTPRPGTTPPRRWRIAHPSNPPRCSQVGILNDRDQGEAGLTASGVGISGRSRRPGATPATLSHRHSETRRGFGPSSSGAISPQCRRAMAEDRDRTSRIRSPQRPATILPRL